MRSTYLVRRVVFVLAVSVTSFAGASAVTNAVSDAPLAGDFEVATPVYRTTPYATPTTNIDLTAGGADPDLTYEVVDQPHADDSTIGTAEIRGHTVALTIDSGAAAGTGSFTYRAIDDEEVSEVATVSFEIANRKPLTRDLTLTTRRNAALDIWPYARDAVDGGPFPWRRSGNRITYSDPEHGTIEPFFGSGGDEPTFARVDHKAVYVPDPGYVGADSFSYTFTDEDGGESTARVSVDVVEPEERGRGERNDVRYRCAVHMRSNAEGQADPDGRFDAGLTSSVARYLGGDLVVGVDADVRAPRTLAPGATYRIAEPTLGLTLQPGAIELLGGVAVGGENLDLDAVGFGQESLGADVTASAMVRHTARGEVRGVRIDGLAARRRPVHGAGEDGESTIAVSGSTGELVAPRRGAVVVSLPQVYGLTLRLAPGLRGDIGTVGLRCYAPGSERLQLARIPVR